MRTRKANISVILLMVTTFLCHSGGFAFAAKGTPMTPELAAKREMVRKQQEQRITHDKRRKAAESLKAERIRIYNAKRVVQQSPPGQSNTQGQ